MKKQQTITIKNTKKDLLANHLGCNIDAIKNSPYKENLFVYEKSDYLVLTNEEANKEAGQQIREHLWSIDSTLIQKHLKTELSIEVIEQVQSEMCDNCLLLLLSLIKDLDIFYNETTEKLGRGHFIAFHDFQEQIVFDFKEYKRYYIYRLC